MLEDDFYASYCGMVNMERVQKSLIQKDLEKKMVLLAGPRQAGKTTLAKEIAKDYRCSVYLNYDNHKDRKILLEESWLPSTDIIVIDEIHKMPRWKAYLKGIYDTKAPEQKLLVIGSARLEIFQRVGDSLAGRYYLHRLMPLSPAECYQCHEKYSLGHFLERGGFPEPFLASDAVEANRWRMLYVDSLLREDVLDFDSIQNVYAIRLVFEMLRERVGSPISYASIARDVGVAPNTVKKYIQILEALYIVFRVAPYAKNIARSLLKEPKIYFFDTGLVRGNDGLKLENLVATCLQKHVYAKIDYLAEPYALHYIQDKERREVDFVLVKDQVAEQMIEVKLAADALHPALKYFHQKYLLPGCQIVKGLKRERLDQGIEVLQAEAFLRQLFM